MARNGLRWLGAVLIVGFAAPCGWSQQVHRNGFESLKPAWIKGGADNPYNELTHNMSDQAHDGQRSEYLRIQANQGNYIYYQYSIGRASLSEEFSAGLWLKANRPGAQILVRVVLPNERDPNNLDSRLATYIRGDVYRNAGRWQRLELSRVVPLAKQQQQLMQAQLKRAVDSSGAYIDAVILNVLAGPGSSEMWIDDLEVGPLAPDAFAPLPTSKPVGADDGPLPSKTSPHRIVEFNGSQLMVGNQRFFFRGLRHSDTPLRILRDAGFNTVFVDHEVAPKLLQEAVDLGFWIVPQMKSFTDDAQPMPGEETARQMSRFRDSDAVLFWHLGGTLAYEQASPLARVIQSVRAADPGRPLGADIWDGMLPYSRVLQLTGVQRMPLMTTLELPRYREWLDLRRRLANPGSFVWTWVQTHLPDWFAHLLYERSPNQGFDEPVGPQPEQIRLLTYLTLAAGYKGIAYWSDRFLADSHQGRDRLLGCGLLNQELDMLEPLLLAADDPPQWIETSVPEVKAAVIRTSKGILVLPIWLGAGSQFVPGQAAVSKLTLVVPQVPQSMQAWEVSPGDVRSLRAERVVGGTSITIPEFGLTSAIVFTADTSLVVRFQEQCRTRRQLAAQWTFDMALYELQKVLRVQEQLGQLGKAIPDADNLIQEAQNRLRGAKGLWDNRLFSEAYREAQRGLRPVRILMRAQWDQAVKGLDSPVSSPYAVSFFTLPRHWQFMEQVGKTIPTANVLPGGDFEIIPERVQESWKLEEAALDEVELLAIRVGEIPQALAPGKGGVPTTVEAPQQGKQCAMLQVKPKDPKKVPHALERTFLALASPPVRLQPGTLVQISGWIRIPTAIHASPDGALFYDSAGGEPLAVRLTDATQWKKITLYRRVPASGILQVTLALTGIGTVYFDDVRIEPLVPAASTASASGQ